MSLRASWTGTFRRGRRAALAAVVLGAVFAAGCAHWNTYYLANKAFREAEQERAEALKAGKEVSLSGGKLKSNYERTILKAQKILDDYPGSGLTDDALFLMSKAHYRLGAFRMSLAKLNLLFANFPNTPYTEEAIYIQALDYLGIGDLANSTAAIELLKTRYPASRYRADAMRVGAENSFTLQQWEAARSGFTNYLGQFPKAPDVDEVGYKLAQVLVELKADEEAARRLQEALATTQRRELAFDARLLLARVLIRLGRPDEAAREVVALREEAEVYKAQGDVALVEAEGLVARGKLGEAAPLLENIPATWRVGLVASRVVDLLGRVYVRQWKLEEARKELSDATRNPRALYDVVGTRQLLEAVTDYLAADQALRAAGPDQVPSLKLNQANALLFGLARPRLALALYKEVADLAAADSAAAARGLFGAALVYRDSLAQPDSAALMLARLQRDFPQSPQAYFVTAGGQADLLAFLREERQRLGREAAADSTRLGRAPARRPPPGVAPAAPEQEPAGLPGAVPAATPGVAPADSTGDVPIRAPEPAAAHAPPDTVRAPVGGAP